MAAQWYVVRSVQGCPQGVSIGPMATATLLELASSGGVPDDDWVRMEGVDVDITVAQFLEMVHSGNVPSIDAEAVPSDDSLPEWLSDVAESETAARPEAASLPEWLGDMLRAEISAIPSLKPVRARVCVGEATTEMPVDWLEDIRQIEESLRLPAPTSPPPTVLPAALSDKTSPTQPPAASPAPLPSQKPSPVPPPPLPSVRAPASQPPADSPEPQGYDPDTGLVSDPMAYARWQKADAQRRQEESQRRLSVAEIFLDAQRAIQEWVDADRNNALVAYADIEVIQTCATVQEVLGRYEGYGPVLREKLLKRLAFLVDNRKKFFKARGMEI